MQALVALKCAMLTHGVRAVHPGRSASRSAVHDVKLGEDVRDRSNANGHIWKWLGPAVAAALLSLGLAMPAYAQGPADPPGNPGETVFNRTCAMCHKPEGAVGGNERAPNVETLRAYPAERILDALISGKMQAQGAQLSTTQQHSVSEWLSGSKLGNTGADIANMTNQCKAPARLAALRGWNGWGAGIANARFQTASDAGIAAKDVSKLKLKWAFGVPGAAQLQSQPTVAGGLIFFGSDSGNIFALDADTGCVHWTAKADASVRTAPIVAPRDGGNGPATVFVGDRRGTLYAFDALSGKPVWNLRLDPDPINGASITAAPAYYAGRLYVGLTGSGEGGPPDRTECCRGRGQIAAVDTATGKIIWRTYTLPEATLSIDDKGRRRWGPSGVGVWATPTVDPKRRRLYVPTANAYSGPATSAENSVLALDLTDGKIVWSHHEVPEDIWRSGCVNKDGTPGCPDKVGPDYDFSSSAMLRPLPNGRDILVVANKGGVAIALDPDGAGRLVWRTNLWVDSPPSFYGDVLFGGAADGAKAYFALQETSAITALDLKDGRKVWSQPFKALTVPDPIGGRPKRKAFGAAVSGLPGVIFAGGWDGVIHALSTTDGKELWSFNTLKSFDTINGVRAKGGSMGGPGVTIANGSVYAVSGYVGVSNGTPGNVLLAFHPQ
jgi:polyvinyl alcohol dehydrogenase (cytochrome)